MARIKELKGHRYNPEKVEPVKVLCPPYDVIEPQTFLKIINGNPYSFAHLVRAESLPPPQKWYGEVMERISRWIEEGLLIEESKSSLYVYRHTAEFLGERIERTGVICLLYNQEYRGKKIIPHESTYELFKKDRFILTVTTGFQLEPIFCIFPDGEGEELINSAVPATLLLKGEGTDGIYHELWRVDDRDFIENFKRLMEDKDVMIADGHHRFEVSRMVAEHFHNNEKGRYVLTFLVPFGDAPVGVFPIHRGLKKKVEGMERVLKENFVMEEIEKEEAKDFFESSGNEKGRFVLFLKERVFGCFLKKEKGNEIQPLLLPFDVAVLHHFLIDRIIPDENERGSALYYTPNPEIGLRMLEEGEIESFFLLPRFHVGHVFEAAKASLKLPHKSTYFYPKIPSGMVFYKIN